MQKDIFLELDNASEYEYINLLPYTKTKLKEVSQLAQQVLVNSFILELSTVKKEDQKESSDQEFRKYKKEVYTFYAKLKKEKEQIKQESEIGQLRNKLEKERLAWEVRYDGVLKASLAAYEKTKLILSCLLPGKQFLQLRKQSNEIEKKMNGCEGEINKTVASTFKLVDNCQSVKESILPQIEAAKSKVWIQIASNFGEAFQNAFQYKFKLVQRSKSNVKDIQKRQAEIREYLSGASTDDKELSKFTQKYHQFKKEVQQLMKKIDLQESERRSFEVLNMKNTKYRDLISSMIKVNEKFSGKVPDLAESKFLIQPLMGTKEYIIVDVTNPVLDSKKYTAPFTFFQQSSFIHLSTSIVIAGGLNLKDKVIKNVRQLFENHVSKTLPSMKQERQNFPLVEFNDGKKIIAIGGSNGWMDCDMDECQMLNQFMKWSDLPSMQRNVCGASACTVGLSRVYVFGGYPLDLQVKVQCLNLNKLDDYWQRIKIAKDVFEQRCFDSACYLEEEKKIIIFGSTQSRKCFQVSVKDDMSIEVAKDTLNLPFRYIQNLLNVWKKYQGTLYAVDEYIQKVWRYDNKEWK